MNNLIKHETNIHIQIQDLEEKVDLLKNEKMDLQNQIISKNNLIDDLNKDNVTLIKQMEDYNNILNHESSKDNFIKDLQSKLANEIKNGEEF